MYYGRRALLEFNQLGSWTHHVASRSPVSVGLSHEEAKRLRVLGRACEGELQSFVDVHGVETERMLHDDSLTGIHVDRNGLQDTIIWS
jgi:hypothetical protein